MKKLMLLLLLIYLVGCTIKDEPNWGDLKEEDYVLMHETKEYTIYARTEYIPTLLSHLDPFSDTCGVVHNNDINYLLYYEGKLQSLNVGIEDDLYTGEELVELGVEGIHCD